MSIYFIYLVYFMSCVLFFLFNVQHEHASGFCVMGKHLFFSYIQLVHIHIIVVFFILLVAIVNI